MGFRGKTLVGRRSGSLVVVAFSHNNRTCSVWECVCDCGNKSFVNKTRILKQETTKCKKCAQESQKSPYTVGGMSIYYWNQAEMGAIKRNLDFTIDREDTYDLYLRQNKLCAISKVPIIFPPNTKTKKLGTASLDRKDSTLGYVPGNVQWVHKIINKMKLDFTEEEFVKWCHLIHLNRVNNNVE